MFQGDRWIFAAPDPAAVGIDLITDMKRALITENYGVPKSLIVVYPMKHLHTETPYHWWPVYVAEAWPNFTFLPHICCLHVVVLNNRASLTFA
jgi:hypothetical protein